MKQMTKCMCLSICLCSVAATVAIAKPVAHNESMAVLDTHKMSSKKAAEKKMKALKALIRKANKQDISVLKEQTALRTAEIFMGYADWDEKHVDANIDMFGKVTAYKKNPEKYANELAEFERQEIIAMMDNSIAELKAVMSGKIKRLPTPEVNWKKVTVDKDQLTYQGKPVFLADWTWKPRTAKYTEYHGNQDGFFLTPRYVEDNQGTIRTKIIKELEAKGDGSLGFVFFNHSAVPNWAKIQDPTITDGPGIKYTMYDIHNPLARQIQCDLIKATVPLMAGKKYTELGYMLCNEPHWITTDKTWASAPISALGMKEFKTWLKQKHGNITHLNKVWGTSFSDFKHVDCPSIMQAKEQGSARYFDFMQFNMYRINQWFTFLKQEVRKYDPQAKTHIKIMPNLWSDNKRDSGIDLETLTRQSDIIGNDASSGGAWMWGKPHAWEKHYSFDWKEMCMAYDFMKSVSPNKVMYNTEGHFLSTGKYRDLYQTPQYVRCNYWLATIHGLTATQSWYWARLEDGSSKAKSDDKGYAGSNNHQPRVVNEVHATIADMNGVSDYMMAFQRQRKDLRIFYTKVSAINKPTHMDDVFRAYERMTFRGTPIGFATEGILKNNKHDWDAIVVYKTPYAFASDIAALQDYIDTGGVVIIDDESLKKDEYGQPLKHTLRQTKGRLIQAESLQKQVNKAFAVVKEAGHTPAMRITQTGKKKQLGCEWRVLPQADGSCVLNLVHFGKSPVTLDMAFAKQNKAISSVTNMLTGEKMQSTLTMQPEDVWLLRIR